MTDPRSLAGTIADALSALDGLRPATSVAAEISWLRTDPAGGAVDLTSDSVEIRVVALRLPLPPLLSAAEARVRAVLAGTEWADASIRLVVTDIDGAAFAG
ncbi:hypothetical protein CU254_38245 [Amycolatopsis sp. AA4]|uniref:hypothetical protein n=1 Tax=Actinomycetes TaxID=1760 RepID=UPI0001B55166|nr:MULTISPECIES: hypothetical protein [Actinomycetes]ATY15580.1 hypothetical protein CU254_38245 [Amycolatopsis sp. AA4]EFL11862.1 predicted protein [Streptomyces sp. AA4]